MPEDEVLSLLEEDERWERYYSAAQKKPSKILALTALAVEDIRVAQKDTERRLKTHCSTPYDKAHLATDSPGANPGISNANNPGNEEGATGRFHLSARTLLRAVILIAMIATGGVTANYLVPLVGG